MIIAVHIFGQIGSFSLLLDFPGRVAGRSARLLLLCCWQLDMGAAIENSIHYSSADGPDGHQGPNYPLPYGEVVKYDRDAIQSLDRYCDESPVVPQINGSLPESKGTGNDDPHSSPILHFSTRNQVHQHRQPKYAQLDQAKPRLEDNELIFHVCFEGVKELIDLVGFKFPLVDIVSE